MSSARMVFGTVFVIRCVAVSACGILWTDTRSRVVELLDKRGIKLTSVDLVQFTWLDKKDGQEVQGEEDNDNDNDVQNDDNSPTTTFHPSSPSRMGNAIPPTL